MTFENPNDRASEAFKSGFLDSIAWPLKPFTDLIMPLAAAIRDRREFEVMQLLRRASPLLEPEQLKDVDVAAQLAEMQRAVDQLNANVGARF